MDCKRIAKVFAPVLALSLGAAGAAKADLITNGDFSGNSGYGRLATTSNAYNTSLTGWTNNGGLAFVMNNSNASSGVSYAPSPTSTFRLWSSSNGGLNTITASPNGGAFVGIDGDASYRGTGLTQTINGLTVGQQYNVSFYWAAGQQRGFDGDTTERWDVSLGSETHSTSTYNLPSHGFSGWMLATMTFTATSASEQLKFLAIGANNPVSGANLPPFLLLDGVTMNAVPEPSTVVMVGLGLAGLVGVGIRRRARSEIA